MLKNKNRWQMTDRIYLINKYMIGEEERLDANKIKRAKQTHTYTFNVEYL